VKSIEDTITDAANAHTNLSVFAVVKGVLESGALYGAGEQAAAAHISKLCDQAMQRQLKVYDKEVAAIVKAMKK
jgi:ABC-type arginine/histidine transport system permease subunit